jgi:hypothetical protein
MDEHNFSQFADLIDDAFLLNPNWKPLPPKGKALYFKALEPFPMEMVSRAMTAHIRDPQRGRFQPSVSDIIAQIEVSAGTDGRPGAEEAWALVQRSNDEAETVVWTAEMRDAFSICRVLLEAGNVIGGRMAFKEAYLRLVAEAVRNNKPVKWEVSLGRDSQKREVAIQNATIAGRLSTAMANILLPGIGCTPLLQLSTSGATQEISREGLARVKAEMEKLQMGSEKRRIKREAERQAQRKAEAERKRAIDLQVTEYAKRHDI